MKKKRFFFLEGPDDFSVKADLYTSESLFPMGMYFFSGSSSECAFVHTIKNAIIEYWDVIEYISHKEYLGKPLRARKFSLKLQNILFGNFVTNIFYGMGK